MTILIQVDDADIDLLGTKETVAMLLEPLGSTRVLQMNVQEPEQMTLISPCSHCDPKL